MTTATGKRNVEAIYPLSPMQQGMLFHSLYAPDSGVYVELLSCTLRGPLALAAFERAWQRVVERHPILRSAFSWKSLDGMVQVVQGQVALPLAYEDWRGLTPDEQERRYEERLRAEGTSGFDMARVPLMRLVLVQLADDVHRLIWAHHHIVLDGWSLPLVLQEVFALYEAYRAGAELELPPARPFRDYIAWLQRQDLGAAEAFWRRELAGFGAPTPLAVGRPLAEGAAPPADTGNTSYAFLETQLAEPLTSALQAAMRRRKLTLNTAVQGAWALLLSRYSGEDDVLFGATVAGRPPELEGVEQIVGLFINTLPVRVRLAPTARLGSWLEELQERQVEQRQYEHTPLVRVQEWSEVPAGTALFQSLLVFENFPVDESLREHRGSLQIEDVRSRESTNYPLTVVAGPGRELTLKLGYDTRRFDVGTIERMLGHWCALLEGFAEGLDRPLADLVLLSAGERAQLAAWNATAVPLPDERCFHRLFAAQVARAPQAVAVTCEDRRLTYAELDARANQLAHYLRRLGVGPEVMVGIALERSPELVVAVLAVLKAGGAFLPLDPTYPPERLGFMLADSRAPVLITRGSIRAQRFPPAASWPNAAPPTVVDLDAAWPRIAEEPDSDPAAVVAPDSLAYVIYTSGSTGRPKGALLEQRGLTNLALVLVERLAITPQSRVLQFAAFSFDAAVSELVMALAAGATLVLAPYAILASPPDLLALLRAEAISVATLPPSLLAVLPQADLPALRTLVSAGEPCPWPVAERWSVGRRLLNGYGPTEATVGTSYYEVTGPVAGARTVPIGQPIANAQMYVLDWMGQPLPVGVPGELCIGGVGVARGYLNRPELSAEKFIADPFSPGGRLYRTGDRVRYLPDGNLEFLGRIDQQVKLRGYRIEPGEIEAALRRHEAVRDAAVLVRADALGEPQLAAYVVPVAGDGHGAPADVAELRAHLRRELPEYMIPQAFVALEAFPLTPSGKVDRRALPAPDGEAQSPAGAVAPRTSEEEIIAALWSQILGVRRVGLHKSFFDLGGHSLRATQLLSRLREAFQIELPLRALFETPTVVGMAALVAEARRSAAGTLLPPITPAPRDGELPLSFAQQRLWFLDQLEPDSALYNNFTALRLDGDLDVAALERSLNELVRRHESLRTTFGGAGRPTQQIAPELSLTLPLVDLSHLPVCERADGVRRAARAEAQRPFDLARGPLLRVTLLRLAEREHVALINIHHIVSDGWSMGVLVREIATIYQAFAAGLPSPLPELSIQYADYAAWQRAWLQGQPLETQLAYWRGQLAGSPAVLELPTDRPRPAVQSFRGASREFLLPLALRDSLAELARRERATLFMALLAGFQALLARYSGQEDLCVGTPIANRTRGEVEGLIGFFVNTLVLRGDLSGDPSFRELLRRARATTLGAYAHQDLPFEMLVEALQPERSMSHSPLFQVMLVLDNTPGEGLELPGLSITPLEADTGTARFDLTMVLNEEPAGLRGMLEYNTDLFDAATIERMLAHFVTLLEAAVADPARPVATLPLLTEAERRQLLVEWNATAAPFPDELCFHQLFEAHAARQPEAPALRFADATMSYGELNRRANRLAHHLRARGVAPGTLVGLSVERSPDLVVGALAALKAGAAFLPLDPAYPPERIAFMLDDAQAPVLLTQSTLATGAGRAITTIYLDADWPLIAGEVETNPQVSLTPEDLAYVIYTSGSTGQPKGALLRHRGLCNLAEFQRSAFGLGPGRRVLQFAALSFDAMVWELAMALGSGALLALAPQEVLASGPELLRLLRDERITTVTLPPSLLAVLTPEDLPDLTTVVAAGEACSAELVARWAPGRAFFNAYGPTETTVCATVYRCVEGEQGSPPIGRPLPNFQLYVLDRQLQPVPVGVPGELHIGGVGLARGYLNRPALSAEKFIADPFSPGGRLYRTGDLVRYRDDGDLEFLGRIDQQVKLRGFRIELGEIEALLRQQPEVQDALVLAREFAPGDRRLVAYVIPAADEGREAGGAPADLRQALIGALRARLPEYMVPAHYVTLAAWPLTPAGKVDRPALLALAAAPADPARAYVPPRTPTEEQLAQIGAELLGLPHISVGDNFFDLGGHSLLATQLVARVSDGLGVELSLRSLFEHPTIEALAAQVDALREARQLDEARITQLLERIDQLSEEEARALLAVAEKDSAL